MRFFDAIGPWVNDPGDLLWAVMVITTLILSLVYETGDVTNLDDDEATSLPTTDEQRGKAL